MTEQTPEQEPQTEPEQPEPAAMFDAPEDVSEELATGYAVYNRTLGRFVGSVSDKRPTKTDARKAVPEGHTAAVVRV